MLPNWYVPRKWQQVIFVVAITGVAFWFGWTITHSDSDDQQTASTTSTAATSTPATAAAPTPAPEPTHALTLISASCAPELSGAYTECQGFVQNLTAEPMGKLEVVIEWLDAAGLPRASETSFVDYDPLQPGQQSPGRRLGRATQTCRSSVSYSRNCTEARFLRATIGDQQVSPAAGARCCRARCR